MRGIASFRCIKCFSLELLIGQLRHHEHHRRPVSHLDVPDLRLDLRRGCWPAHEGIAPGTRWEDVPMNWTCPECGARKEDFEMVEL